MLRLSFHTFSIYSELICHDSVKRVDLQRSFLPVTDSGKPFYSGAILTQNSMTEPNPLELFLQLIQSVINDQEFG